MLKFIFLVSFVFVLCHGKNIQQTDDLIAVAVVYRHGDRAPAFQYKNDPHSFSRLKWPVGKGQLLARGKQRHFALGQWFRTRYNGFLTKKYKEDQIYVQSSDIDRVIMSALSNLAGLYIPKGNQIWHRLMPWQPIPVHTIPRLQDDILAMAKPCAKYEKLNSEVKNSSEILTILEEHKDLMKYMEEHSGNEVKTVANIKTIHDTLQVEAENGLLLPEWTKSIFPQNTSMFHEIDLRLACYNEELSKFKAGPFWFKLINFFNDISKKNSTKQKFMMFAGHDETLSCLLNSVQLYQGAPKYASTLIIELRGKKDGPTYVNMLYKEEEQVTKLTMNNCTFDCESNKFTEILKPVTLDPKDWEKECEITK